MFWNLIYGVTSGSVSINYMCLRKSDEPPIHVKSLSRCRTLKQPLSTHPPPKKTLMSIYYVPSMILVAGHSVAYCTQRSFPCLYLSHSLPLYLNEQYRKCISFSDCIFRFLQPKTGVHQDLLSIFCFSGHQFPWPVQAVQCAHQQLTENVKNTCLRYRWHIFVCGDALEKQYFCEAGIIFITGCCVLLF